MVPNLLKSSSLGKVFSLSSLLLILLPAAGTAGTPPPAPPAPPAPPVHMARGTHTPAAPEADSEDQAKPKRAWLGVFLSEDDDSVSISGVKTGGPAEKAGLKEGDTIVEIDNTKVSNSKDVRSAIRSLEPGDTVQIIVMRDGKKKSYTATLGEAPQQFWSGEGFPGLGHGFGPITIPGMGLSRTYLGVRVQSMTEELREYFKAPRGRGVLVSRVEEDTPAGKAGLRAGDVIIAVDGKGIADRGDIGEALADKEPGDTVAVKIVRDGAEKTLNVEVAERPAPKARHGAFVAPGSEKSYWLGDDEDGGIEIQDLEDAPDSSQIRRQVEQAREEARAAMRDSAQQRQDVERELQQARKALEISKLDLKRQIKEELEAAQAYAAPNQDEIRLKVKSEMDRVREALREAMEAARQAQESNEI